MVKLIRLSSQDDKAVFTANFDTDIPLGEGAQIAVKNAVFQVNRSIGTFDSFEGDISTKNVSEDNKTNFVALAPGNYNQTQFKTLMRRIANTLNRGLDYGALAAGGTAPYAELNENFSMYNVYLRNNGLVCIDYRYSPLLRPSNSSFATNDAPFNVITSNNVANPTDGKNRHVMDIAPANAARTDEAYRYVALKSIEMSQGSGIFSCQVYNSVVDANPAQNGFGIGISFEETADDVVGGAGNVTDPRDGRQNMNDEARNIEILFTDVNTPYKTRVSAFNTASVEETSALNPRNVVDTTADKNDIIELRIGTESRGGNPFIGKKFIAGFVIQDDGAGGATETRLFTHHLSEIELGEEVDLLSGANDVVFTPYLFFRGNRNNIRINDPVFSPNPFRNPKIRANDPGNLEQIYFPLVDAPYYRNVGAGDPSQDSLNAELRAMLPTMVFRRFVRHVFDNVITLSSSISKVLGSSQNLLSKQNLIMCDGTDANLLHGFAAPPRLGLVGCQYTLDRMPFKLERDFYMIESLNLNVDSYNSSVVVRNLATRGGSVFNTKGERKNILDTIPATDDRQALITYEPNEKTFVDIKNSSDINLRNLRIRIVDELFIPIQTQGLSNITLVVKEKDE